MSYPLNTINETLLKAGRLKHRVIGVFATDNPPKDAKPVSGCIAKAIFNMAMSKDASPVYTGGETLSEGCWAMPFWTGYKPMPDIVNNILSNGAGTGRKGLYLKDTPEICKRSLDNMGEITPPSSYITVAACDGAEVQEGKLLSLICFGNSEQIRILSGLVHFSSDNIFTSVVAAWGSGCANFITFPGGMAASCPKDTAFISPIGYEANVWFPEDMLAISFPLSVAERITESYDRSFAVMQADVTYPSERQSYEIK